jgi:membrane glycosyltransferase
MMGARIRTALFLGVVALTSLAGVWMMLRIVAVGGFTPLEAIILGLFAPTFAWIVVPFWTSVVGFVRIVLGRTRPVAHHGPLVSRTALVMPIHNEDPRGVAARLSAIARSLEATSQATSFHFHILSDTTHADIALREEAAWATLQGTHPNSVFFYRRRERNTGRKAGNIAEFCDRCVDDYDFMVVLDADSVMDGGTLVRLAADMEADPSLGLIQTVPLPVRQETLFGRLVQFGGCLHGPLLAAGQAFWQGDTANYWGHNAIIRLRPFAEHARLPVLSGSPPLGGEILSHDFVEAALLRRAGWKVRLDPTEGGSWEEVPGTVPDFARRDRRWAQGSLQHLRLLGLPGLRPLSRLHLLLGALGYLTSPLWLLFLLAGTAYVFFPGLTGAALTLEALSAPVGISLLAATAVVLFLPKVLAVALAVARARHSPRRVVRTIVSALGEALFSVLLAPFMMLVHTRFVVEIALGRTVGWDATPRTGRALTWGTSLRVAAGPTLIGAIWGGLTLAVSPGFFIWMSPIFAGLALAAPLVRWSSSPALGGWARRRGLFVSRFEFDPPFEIRAVDGDSRADPRPVSGVSAGASGAEPDTFILDQRPMHNAERGLFDLSRGRLLLVRPPEGEQGEAVLLAAVETLTERTLGSLVALAAAAPRVVLTRHRASAMGIEPTGAEGTALGLPIHPDATPRQVRELSSGAVSDLSRPTTGFVTASETEAAGLALAHLARLIPAVVAATVSEPRSEALTSALSSGAFLDVDAAEIRALVAAAGASVERVSEAPVPLADSVDSRFILFRESHGLGEHVAILVGRPEEWPDPVPARIHSACLTGDLFGSLRCDCGEQLRGSLEVFRARGGGVLLYLAQEGRGIGLGNKFRAYTLQEGGLDTIDADETLGFGADERRYDIAARILDELGVSRIELLTNNPEKVDAMETAGITVVRRSPLHGRLNRHNLPYVRAKVQRAGHWLGDMLSQPISGD